MSLESCSTKREIGEGHRMKLIKGIPLKTADAVIDLTVAVRELHGLGSQEINKLLRDSENFIIHLHTGNEVTVRVLCLENTSFRSILILHPTLTTLFILQIDMERLATLLPLHLMGVLLSSRGDEPALRYLLCGLRLLHVLCDLAPRHNKLEQILLDDVKISEQLLDLIFYLLIIIHTHQKENHQSSAPSFLVPAVVPCSLYLLTSAISTQWQDLVQVLLAHSKVNLFMDAAFGAVHVAVRSLQVKLSAQITSSQMTSNPTVEQTVNYLCQQCEASIQFLHSLCQQKLFRERILRSKVLCAKGSILFLVQTLLKLKITTPVLESPRVVSSLSRIKAKALSILLNLCEAESISFLDEVASSQGTLEVAKSVALEVLEVLRVGVCRGGRRVSACPTKSSPTGLLQLNALRLADVFSDDSNFRSYITTSFTKVMTAIFSLPHGEFLSIWCSSELPPREEDATLDYDAFAASGWVLNASLSSKISSTTTLETNLISNSMPQASYSHQRTSLFVKVIANLHCFVPNICEGQLSSPDSLVINNMLALLALLLTSNFNSFCLFSEQERNLFLHKFLECMRLDPAESLPGFSFSYGTQKAATVCRNLRSLLCHAESLVPNFLNEEDVQLLRVFFNQLQAMITRSHFEEVQSAGGGSSPSQKKELSNTTNRIDNQEETSEISARKEEQPNSKREDMSQGDIVRHGLTAFRESDSDAQNVETSGSDTKAGRGNNFIDHTELSNHGGNDKESGAQGVQEDEKIEAGQSEEKQPRKRKRTIMNDYQISLIEKALLDEPDMQRNATSIQIWADKLSLHGAEVTCSQLKNWLNNRKARLARVGKDARAEVDNASPQVKQAVQQQSQSRDRDSPESPAEDNAPSSGRVAQSTKTGISESTWIHTTTRDLVSCGVTQPLQYTPGQRVVLVDGQGLEVAKGMVCQVKGKWYGKSLEDDDLYAGLCVVEVAELKADRSTRLPYPSETTGDTFGEAESLIGEMRVLWDPKKLYLLRSG
ncbi:Nodulin homeobox [Linum perenne]